MSGDAAARQVDAVAAAAGAVAPAVARTTAAQRQALLDAIAAALQGAAGDLVALAIRETHLPEARLRVELDRTAFQLRAFGRAVRGGRHLHAVIEHADDRYPLGAPAPDLRALSAPVGPIAVFAAGNFPFAFSVAGGDTASALAAGCPVIVKAHPGHPALSRAVAALVSRAVLDVGAEPATFALIEGQEAGVRLLRHPAIRAAAFTGSTVGGRALFDIAAARPDPIPFYGELGSINPVFVTAEALAADAASVADGFTDSYTTGSGQLCTKPGVIFVPSGTDFVERVAAGVDAVAAAPMLDERIRAGYDAGADLFAVPGVEAVRVGGSRPDGVEPSLYRTDMSVFLTHGEALTQERFGPSALVVEYDDVEDLPRAARAIEGSLTATVRAAGPADRGLTELVEELRARSGRLVYNGWPTGVTVSAAMMHGGPWPSSTASAHTSVGLSAMDRFLRPVAYQNFPPELLPPELRDGADVPQEVDAWRAP
jgi:NADP-dependent aldehyde dehydrogenase